MSFKPCKGCHLPIPTATYERFNGYCTACHLQNVGDKQATTPESTVFQLILPKNVSDRIARLFLELSGQRMYETIPDLIIDLLDDVVDVWLDNIDEIKGVKDDIQPND